MSDLKSTFLSIDAFQFSSVFPTASDFVHMVSATLNRGVKGTFEMHCTKP